MKRLALGLMALSLLAGCGVKGGLERPDPMWNREEAMTREREQLERQQEEANRRRGQTTTQAPATAAPPPSPTTEGDANSLPQAPH